MKAGLMVLASVWVTGVVLAGGTAPPPPVNTITGQTEGVFAYKFETASLHFEDRLVERGGTLRLGKVMEWADQILFFDQSGERRVYGVDEVESIEARRSVRHLKRPKQADLTVAYVERLPRMGGYHDRVRVEEGLPRVDSKAEEAGGPKDGEQVTFRVHILNAGGAASGATTARFMIDSVQVHSAELPELKAGVELTLEFKQVWKDEAKAMRVELDPEGKVDEIAKWNNTFEEPVRGLGVTAVVARDLYEQFRTTRNLVDTFCFEDWFQYHVRTLNGLFAASAYPSAPDGIEERVRCDRVIVVDNPIIASWPSDRAAVAVFEPTEADQAILGIASYVDWKAIQDIARELGLISLRSTDTSIRQCMIRDENGFYFQARHLFPWPATMMYEAGGHPFTEAEAHYLNQVRGRPRGMSGEYLYGTPETIKLDVRANDGGPAAEVQIAGFQLNADGEFAGCIGNGTLDPLFEVSTDANGIAVIPNQPVPDFQTANGYRLRANPFGKIAPDGSNGLLMLRLRMGSSEECRVLRLFDCNVAYARGQTGEYVHPVLTRFGRHAEVPAPPYTAVLPRTTTDEEQPQLFIQWPFAPGLKLSRVAEFRVYRRVGYGADESPWSLLMTVGRGGEEWKPETDISYLDTDWAGRGSRDVFLAASEVDKDGRESSPAPIRACVTDGKDAVSFAITPEHQAYIPVTGDPECQILHYNGAVGTQPYGLRFRKFEGYLPTFAGATIASDGRLLMADRMNHVIGVYDRGDLLETWPRRASWPARASNLDGEFNDPVDVAVDASGRVFVADRGNNRIQILDNRGTFTSRLDADFKFDAPEAVAFSNARLCVTDRNGSRVRIYDVSESTPKFVREVGLLVDANRALVSATGHIYVTGRDPATKDWAVLVYAPDGEGAKFKEAILKAEGETGDIRRPRGFAIWTTAEGQFGYFVNRIPFNIRRVPLQ